MSLNGWREIQLANEQKEQIRLERVRGEVGELCASCRHEMSTVNEPAVQQLAREGLQRVHSEVERAAGQLQADPDQALQTARAAQKNLHRVLANAQVAAHRWSEEQATTRARLSELRSRAEIARKTEDKAAGKILAQLDAELKRAEILNNQGRFLETMSVCTTAEKLLANAATAGFDETVRRKVVSSLLQSLQKMGFVIEGPRLNETDSESGVVVLTGRLPSGRTARFEVKLDGHLHYDLNGYEGRTCAAEVERVEQALHQQFGIKLGPAQVVWKNPDRIAKGARNAPTGGRSATGH